MPGDRFDKLMKKLLDIVNNIDTYTPKEIIEKIKELDDEEIFEYFSQKDLEEIIERYLSELPIPKEDINIKKYDPIKYIEENTHGDTYTITMFVPEADEKEIKTALEDNKLIVEIGDYREEIPISIPVEPKFKWTYNNGVLDIKFKRKE